MDGMTGTVRRRLAVEERRADLLEVGLRLFGSRAADDVAVEDIAREAGVSSGLLYHYFGSKKEFQVAVTAHAYEQLIEATEPHPDLPPGGQLVASLRAYVDFVRENARWWAWLPRGSGGGDAHLEALGDRLRDRAAQRVLRGLPAGATTPVVELAVRGWVGFNAEVALAWVAQGPEPGLGPAQVVDLMVGSLLATLAVAGVPPEFLDVVRADAREAAAD